LRTYCRSEIARNDRGCQYGRELRELPPTPPEATESYQDPPDQSRRRAGSSRGPWLRRSVCRFSVKS